MFTFVIFFKARCQVELWKTGDGKEQVLVRVQRVFFRRGAEKVWREHAAHEREVVVGGSFGLRGKGLGLASAASKRHTHTRVAFKS